MRPTTVPRPTLLALLLTLAFSASAAELDQSLASASMASVTIVGHHDDSSYQVKRSTAGTRTDTAIADLPQSITVINQALIQDAAMQSMADVARYVPGIGMANGEGNRDAPIFRGITNASGDFYIDGVRDDVEYYRDLYNVEQVEALTGPNAMIFGRGGSGGIINRVTRQAHFGVQQRSLDLALGSYQNRRLSADIGQVLNDTLALRVNALLEDSGGYQRNARLKRQGINPTLALRPDADTRIVLGYEHFEDRRRADRGLPSLNGRPMDLPVDAFIGDPAADRRPVRLQSDALSSIIEHDFRIGLHLSNTTRYTDYDKFYQNYNPGAVNSKAGTVAVSAYNNHQWRKNLFNQTDLTVDLRSGGLRHKLLAGMELGWQDTDYLRMTGVFANKATSISVPLAAADGALPVSFMVGGSNSDRDASSRARTTAVYVQDQIEFSPQWQLIAGLRYDRFTLDYDNHVAGGSGALLPAPAHLASRDNLFSPRLGIVYKPVAPLTVYANYSVASFPRGGDQLSSLNSVNQGLKPEKFTNYELGGKLAITPDLLATVAVYRLNRQNVAVTNPATGIADQLVDGQRSTGVEVGLSGQLAKGWSVHGGYAHQDAKLLATTSATALNGAAIGMVPRSTASLWNRYDFNPTLGVGLGLVHRADMFTSTSNAVLLPAYTRTDAALYYAVNAQLRLQLNVENLTDKKYYLYANGDNNITPGSPRAYRLSLHTQF